MHESQISSRSRILNAALECMERQGFVGTSMRTLASQVGIQPGSIYHHFSSKQELLSELLFGQQSKRLQSARTACSGKCPGSALLAMSEALWSNSHRDYVHTSLSREARYLSATDKAAFEHREELLVLSFQQVLILGVKQGSFFLGDTYTIARAVIAIIEDAALRPDSSLQNLRIMIQSLVGSAGFPNSDG